MTIGIERLTVYLPGEVLAVDDLAAARGRSVAAFEGNRGRRALAVAAPCEDVVTLAATAGARVLRAAGMGTNEIGMLLVASATAPASLRPVARYVHGLLGLGAHCRTGDVVAGTLSSATAVHLAHEWVKSGGFRNRCALVVAADVARGRPRTPNELDQGAAAVAMVVGLAPQVLILSEDGVPLTAVDPATRPSYRATLTAAFEAFRHAERPPLDPAEAMTDRFAQMLYQAASPAAARAAHRHLLRVDWQSTSGRWPATDAEADGLIDAAVRTQTQPWTDVLAQVGNPGTAAVWLALAAAIEAEGRRLGGRRVGAFAFDRRGGGEFFSGLIPAAVGLVADTGLGATLAARATLPIDEYERRAGRVDGGDPPPGFAGDFLYVTTRRRRRVYVARTPSTG